MGLAIEIASKGNRILGNSSRGWWSSGTPLHSATQNGNLSVVEYLVNRGADFKDGINGESYLHWASRNGYLSVVGYLVYQKADINAKNTNVDFLYLIILLFI